MSPVIFFVLLPPRRLFPISGSISRAVTLLVVTVPVALTFSSFSACSLLYLSLLHLFEGFLCPFHSLREQAVLLRGAQSLLGTHGREDLPENLRELDFVESRSSVSPLFVLLQLDVDLIFEVLFHIVHQLFVSLFSAFLRQRRSFDFFRVPALLLLFGLFLGGLLLFLLLLQLVGVVFVHEDVVHVAQLIFSLELRESFCERLEGGISEVDIVALHEVLED